MARNRRSQRKAESISQCCICGELRHLTFEHVPPQKAFNSHRAKSSSLDQWLAREEAGGQIDGRIVQGGGGRFALCAECNSFTGSKYAGEYIEWAQVAASYLRQFEPSPRFAQEHYSIRTVQFGIGEVAPLRMAKQMVAMMLATSGPGLAESNPELREFVLKEDQFGLSPRYRLYLNLFNDRRSRSSGVTASFNTNSGLSTTGCEVAHFPFACALSLDEEEPLHPVGNVTDMAFARPDAPVGVKLRMLVGFGNTPFPNDLRTRFRVDVDAEWSDRMAFLP